MPLNISEIVASWPTAKFDPSWRVAPAGLTWIKEGSFIHCGNGCMLGDNCRLGDSCALGDNCRLGDGCTLGSYCALGDNCRLGSYCALGDNCRLGSYCALGGYCALGDNCTLDDGCALGGYCALGSYANDPIDLGHVDGYRKCLAWVDGVPYIGAGCRWFPLEKAFAHWSNKPDRVQSLALCHYAQALVNLKKGN